MISQEPARHNLTLPGLWLILAAALLSGCGSKTETDVPAAAAKAPAGPICGLTVNTTGWETFYGLATDLKAGVDVPRSDLDAYRQLQSVHLWAESMEHPPTALRLSNWLVNAFAPKVPGDRPEKRNADKKSFTRSFRYSFDRAADIESKLDIYRSEDHCCALMTDFRRWLSPRNAERQLVMNFLPGKPEIRSEKNQLFVDTGVLAASTPEQLNRQLTALLYRTLEARPGQNPLKTEGSVAVAEAMRVMLNEGVAIYIEDLPATYFHPSHPTLGKISIVAEDMFLNGVRNIGILNSLMPQLVADPALMAERGLTLAETLAAGGAFQQCGYAMAVTIAGHLGEDRLREVRLSPPAWLAAYQEAALLNGTPPATVGRYGVSLHETMPAFTADSFTALHGLLLEYFPSD